MSWIQVFCKKPGCLGEFKVDESVPKRRCHKCGTLHLAPWGQHDPRREPPENNYPPVLTCEGCFEEFDVRREPVSEYQTNMFRCPRCGLDHSAKSADDPTRDPPAPEPASPEVVETEPVAADGGATPLDKVDDLRAALEENGSGGELHVHFHTDG